MLVTVGHGSAPFHRGHLRGCAGGTAVKDIYYVNSNNEKIDLLEPPYMLQTGELFGYKWNYESKQRLGGGSVII